MEGRSQSPEAQVRAVSEEQETILALNLDGLGKTATNTSESNQNRVVIVRIWGFLYQVIEI